MAAPDTTVLETPRLQLRLMHAGDDSDHALYRDLYMDAVVMRRIGEPLTAEAASRGFGNACRHNRNHSPGHRFWRVEHAATRGRVGLAALRRDGVRAEIGVMLFSEWWNRGICGEIFEAVLRYGFVDLGLAAVDARSAEDEGLPVIERLLAPFDFVRTRSAAADGIRHWELTRAVWQARRTEGA